MAQCPSVLSGLFSVLMVLCLWMCTAGGAMTESGQVQTENICNEQSFTPSCTRLEVLMVEQALYGRMRINECAVQNFGYMGCKRDVLPYIDSWCSGRHTCSVKVLDQSFPVQRCHADLKGYLEVQYRCLKVFTPASTCNTPIIINDTSGYIASVVTMETGCGKNNAPFKLVASPGQRFNITLYDFESGNVTSGLARVRRGAGATGGGNMCKVYATIKESQGSRSVTICGEDQRLRTVYISLKHSIEIRVYSKGHFILHYEVIGCPDPDRPVGGWVKRNEQSALFGCDETSEVWQWSCSGTLWVGQQRNCTPALLRQGDTSGAAIPMGLSIVIVVILALVVGAIILIIGLVCLKRPSDHEAGLRRKRGDASSIPLQEVPGDGDDKHTVVCAVRNTHTTTVIHRMKDEQGDGANDNDYATTKLLTLSDNHANEGDYGEYLRRTKALGGDPYYLSRLECCHPPEGPDLTQGDYQKADGDAIIVDLGQQGPRLPHPCPCVHADDACPCGAAPDFIYSQQGCRVCDDSVSVGGGPVPGNSTLGRYVHHHSKDTLDPNCVLCSLPRTNQPANMPTS